MQPIVGCSVARYLLRGNCIHVHRPPPRNVRTKSVRQPNAVVLSYSELLKTVRAEGLLEAPRRLLHQRLCRLVLLMTGTWFGFALIGHSWYQLLIAAALGILCTQLSFLAHEAGHRQIFASRRANDWAAASWPLRLPASATPGGNRSTAHTTTTRTSFPRTRTSRPEPWPSTLKRPPAGRDASRSSPAGKAGSSSRS